MKQETIRINSQLWRDFTNAVQEEGKQPMRVVSRLLREYLEIRKDTALFEKMRASVRGPEMTDEEAVEFVHQYRREKRLARNGASRRAQTAKRGTRSARVHVSSR